VGEGLQRWTVGAVTVTGVCEAQTDHIPPQFFFPEASSQAVAQHASWLVPDHGDDAGNVSLRVQAFVVEVGSRTIVVDPCVGNGRERNLPFWSMQDWPFMERFEAAGFDAAGVDQVVHTHLHADHVGWGTRPDGDGGWTPTFVNARYLYTARELEYSKAPDNFDPNAYVDAVAPVLAAGLGDLVEEDADLGDGLRLEPTAGHTPGHVSMWIESGGEVALVSGDWLHHPVQLAEPHWAEIGDFDVEQARDTRRRMLERLADTGALLLGTHFAAPSAGRVVRDGTAFRFSSDSRG
jgi:glyoxylase-like metal-dependent hydrolase (beta-lactamase superfamily II)